MKNGLKGGRIFALNSKQNSKWNKNNRKNRVPANPA